MQILKGKSVLVTGGSGFIGTNLIARLLKEGADVLNISLNPPQLEVSTIIDDLRTSTFSFLDQDFDYVIHLAALSNNRLCEDLEVAFDTNVSATIRLLEALKNRPVKKIIFASSIVLYAKDAPIPLTESSPTDIHHDNYTFTKGLAEQITHYMGKKLPILTLRLGNVFGPHQDWRIAPNIIPQIMTQALTNKKIELLNPTAIRDFIFVQDVVNAIMLGMISEARGVFNCASGIGTSVGNLANEVAQLTGSSVIGSNQPIWGPSQVACDITKIKQTLSWKPQTSLKHGLEQTLAYYQAVLL